MRKFQAIYRVTIYSNDATVIIGAHYEEDKDGKKILVQEPARLTCQFNVTRDILSDSNKATINLYNLAPSTREKIFQDAMTLDPEKQKYVHLEAGYGNSLSTIFKGRILQAYSHRSGGSTDVITEIQAQALDIFDSTSSHTFAAGTTFKDAVMTLANDMPNVNLANIGQIEGSFKTSTTFEGKTLECLNEVTGGAAFVDGSNLNVLMNNEVLDVPVPVITDSSGLLGTPRRRDANLEIEMLFEPTLTVGQLLEIKSEVAPNFNGQFKVVGFTHNCMISGSQGGNRTTSVNLWIGPLLPESPIYTQEGPTGGAAPVSGFNKVNGDEISPINDGNSPNWIMPCKGPITSNYGWRVHPIQHQKKFHKGIDIAVPIGTPVKAIADGTISYAGANDPKGYGKYVIINHGKVNGTIVTSEYGHLSSWCVSINQKVKQGQIIARSGNTGGSNGPHCHLTIKENGSHVNPLKYVKN